MKKFKQAEKDLIDFSNLLLENKISFINKWDMEQCKKVYKIKNWKKTPNRDPEWVYMLNRMDFLNKLIISYELTKNIEYINKYFEYWDSWNDCIYKYMLFENEYHNNVGISIKIKRKFLYSFKRIFKIPIVNPIRTLDTAIRCFSVTNDYLYLKKLELIKEKRSIDLKENILSQLEFIKKNHQSQHDKDNWGLIQNIYALYCLIVFDKTDTELYKWNDNKYKALFKQQILEDGSQLENTPLYHIQIFIAASHLLNIKRTKKIKISDFEILQFEKMAEYIYKLSDFQNNIVNLGDSDITNVSELMYIAYFILNDKKYLQRINSKLDICFLSRFTQGIFEFENIFKYNNKEERFFLENSKSIILKDSEKYLLVSNNENFTSHRHIDLGSFVYYVGNSPVFIDSGRYQYIYNKNRKYLKSQFAHNTLYMDNVSFAKILDNWNFESYIEKVDINLLNKNIVATNIESKNIVYKRMFVMLDNGLLIVNIIKNKMDCKKHEANRNYILNTDIEIKQNNDFCKLITNQKEIYIYTNAEIKKIKSSICSKSYNDIEKNKKLVFSNKFRNYSLSFDLFLNKKCTVKFLNNKCFINEKIITIDNDDIVKTI